jgi:glycosyltransferase involved in cell wall biosynthesis
MDATGVIPDARDSVDALGSVEEGGPLGVPAAVAPPTRVPTVTVVVPAYNEAQIIVRSLTVLVEHLRGIEHRYRWELIVVDDGSSDGTGEIAEVFAARHDGVRVLRHPVNFRLGQALRYAISEARGDYLVAIDCDLSYSPDHIERMLDALVAEHAKIVLASPYMKGGRTSNIPFGRRVMSRSVNRMLAATSQGHLSTLTGMVRAYDTRFLKSLNLKAMGPEVNLEILQKATILRARVIEVPAHLDWSEQRERAKARRKSLRINTTTKLYLFSSFIFRPIAFFAVPGLLLMAVSAWTIGSVFLSTFRNLEGVTGSNFDIRFTKAVAITFDERPQSFIVGGVSLMLSVQLLSLALLASQAKRYFDELFHLGTAILRRTPDFDRAAVGGQARHRDAPADVEAGA